MRTLHRMLTKRDSLYFSLHHPQVTMCCRTLLDPSARAVLKPTLLDLCRQSFQQLLDKEKAAQAKQVCDRSYCCSSVGK